MSTRPSWSCVKEQLPFFIEGREEGKAEGLRTAVRTLVEVLGLGLDEGRSERLDAMSPDWPSSPAGGWTA